MIPFNLPAYTGNEDQYLMQSVRSSRIAGDGQFTAKCHEWFTSYFSGHKALMTPSCTQALEMCALLIDIQPGDEVILPSYTFVSTANAFVLRGAKVVFVDIRPDTLNIDEELIESAITVKTKAIVIVHYAGVSCEMDKIKALADNYSLFLIEDAAQALGAKYKGKLLGTFGHMSTFSFHETKNITSGGEGGLLLFQNDTFLERAEILREKGTNRKQFFQGKTEKYSWVDIGSSYLPSELQAAYLWGQLEKFDEICLKRMLDWNRYHQKLDTTLQPEQVEIPLIPESCEHNGHIFYLKLPDLATRATFINHLNNNGIAATFHYVPLHSSGAGQKFGRFSGADVFTTKESERIVRLPMFHSLNIDTQDFIIDKVTQFWS
tara:strand:+ start:7723 stop:8853 length:1131 start_codon:yes stop_codon:yes gene_type:complete